MLKDRALSLSARRAWIEIIGTATTLNTSLVALRKESVDRNQLTLGGSGVGSVALRKESVDRNGSRPQRPSRALGRSPQGERG